MTRREKLTRQEAKLERTREAFMEGVVTMLHRGAGWVERKEGKWNIRFGPPHCSSLGPSRRRERESRPGMIHTVCVPESWLEDVYAQDLAVIDDGLVLSAWKARCELEGFDAWGVVALLLAGRKVRPLRGLYVVRFGGFTEMAENIELACTILLQRIRDELGLAEEPLPF